MSPSFVDKLRKDPPTDRRRVRVIGFDPDVSVLGFAAVQADIGGGVAPEHLAVDLHVATYTEMTGKKAVRGKHQAYEVAADLVRISNLNYNLSQPNAFVVVESQDFYPNRNDTRPKMVAQANALIMIAHVSGAAHALAVQHGRATKVVQPSQWKGTRSKEADHERSERIVTGSLMYLGGGSISMLIKNGTFASLPSKWEHALDGLGMALYGIEQLHRGIWT